MTILTRWIKSIRSLVTNKLHLLCLHKSYHQNYGYSQQSLECFNMRYAIIMSNFTFTYEDYNIERENWNSRVSNVELKLNRENQRNRYI